MNRFAASLLVLALLVGTGCQESTPPADTGFELSLTITDPQGTAVPGIEAKLQVPITGIPWISAAKPASTVEFRVPELSDVSIVVYDLEGRLVKTLFARSADPGRHQVVLATDEQGRSLVGTHLYRCEMIASVGGVERFRDHIYMSLYTSIDLVQQPVLGTSDQAGRIRFTDATEFPFLYEMGPQRSYDELGEPGGTFDFSNTVRITLIEPASGAQSGHEVVIGAGRNQVTLIWDPDRTRGGTFADTGLGPQQATPMQEARKGRTDGYSLGPNIPNPFN